MGKVLYIAGAGRSGSTVVDLLLGAHKGVVSVGELRFLWQRGVLENQRCGCGVPLRECSFWADVLSAVLADRDEKYVHWLAGIAKYLDRRRNMLWMTQGGGRWQSGELAEYAGVLKRLYETIASRAGAEVVVDSSKWPTMPLVLARGAGLDVMVLHIVRDSRAVAYSWTRRKQRPEILGRVAYMAQFSPSVAARGWVITNVLAGRLQFHLPYLRVRYEDFADDPEGWIAKIGLWAGWRFEGVTFERLGPGRGVAVEVGTSHTVSGNPVRFEAARLQVRADMEWQRGMKRWDKAIVTLLTAPLLARYGYGIGRDPARG